MGLYDNYKQTNSNQIFQYAGAPVAEMEKVGNYLQGEYMAVDEGLDTLGTNLKGAKVYSADQAAFDKKAEEYRTYIAKAREAGNYEDMGSQVRRQGRKFAADYMPFAENFKRVQSENEDLNKGVTAGTYTQEFANYAQEARKSYKGLTQKPDGTYSNEYVPRTFAKNVDIHKEILAGIKAMPVHELTKSGLSGTITQEGGTYFVNTEQGRQTIEPERIKEVINRVMNREDVRSYKNQYYDFKYANLEGHTYENTPGPDSVLTTTSKDAKGKPVKSQVLTLKGQAKEYADKNGISFNEAFKKVITDYAPKQEIEDLKRTYTISNAKDNRVNKMTLGAETANSQDARKKAAANADRLQFQGATSSSEERNYSDITDGIKTNTARLAEIDQKLKGGALSQIDRDEYEKEKTRLLSSVDQDNAMINNTINDLTVDLPGTIKGATLYTKGTGFKNDLQTMSVPKGVIIKALKDNKVSYEGSSMVIETARGKIHIPNEQLPKNLQAGFIESFAGDLDKGVTFGLAGKLVRALGLGGNNIVKQIPKTVEQNSAQRQSTTISTTLTSSESSQIGDNYNSNKNNYEVYKDGKLITDTSDFPNLNFTAINSEKGGNNSNFYDVNSKDPKDESHYKVLMKGNSNVTDRIIKNSREAGFTLDNPFYTKLSTAEINSPVKIDNPKALITKDGKNLGTPVSVMKIRSPNQHIAYYLLDANGNKLQHPEGGDFYETDIAKVQAILK